MTGPLYEVALPVHARQKYGNGVQLPVLMEPGTFAVDRSTGDEAGESVVAPGDMRRTRLIPEKRGGACCGLDGADGPNMACGACDLPVATRIDDCSLWQQVRLDADAVRRVPVDTSPPEPLSWAELVRTGEPTPPFEPIGTWGGALGTGHYWSWSPRWEAAVGQGLAHLVVASRGQRVEVPAGMAADVFQRALDALLPAGPLRRRAVLAGPGRPARGTGADILLVPVHPRTGRTWAPTGPAHLVPLPLGVWLWLVSPRASLPVPVSGRIPRDVLRDDPLPPLPNSLFRADRETFERTLRRLADACGPEPLPGGLFR